MAADTASAGSNMTCPDPSAHQHTHGKGNLSEAASTAALLAANNHKGDSKDAQQQSVLDADGKLSSRSAATSLKHANAKDLPSFPSSGNTAGSASKAALLANDYKMKELWHPELSEAGSKAALLANEKGAKLDLWQASASADGQSAATLAFRNKGLGPDVYQGNSPDAKNKALMAATMSNNSARQRAGSTPKPVDPSYPDSANSAANALGAATASYRTSTMKTDGWNSESNQAARIINSKTDASMYTSNIHFESEDDKHQAALRASAMSMAKQIYATQNRSVMAADPDGGAGADAAMARSQSTTQPDIKLEAMRYIHLQEAAHKLASERLAKIDKDMEDSRYRAHYGYEDKPNKRLSRMSMRSSAGASHGRNRANSESTRDWSDSDDEAQASRIRSQMNKLNSGVNALDAKNQQADRARLMAAAEKRVSARMQDMDAKVFADTGKVSPAMQEQWEAKARERAEKDRELRAQNPGKTHIGGGKFMDDAEIEAIAAARLKPTLDEINDTAEKRRARDEELRQIKQEQERVKMEETAQKQAQKEEFKRIKDHDKAIAQKEKEEERQRKHEEKQRAKEEQRKSREVKRDTVAAGAAGATLAEVADKVKDEDEPVGNETANAGVERHRSAISRLKDKFRKSGAPAGSETATHHDETDKSTPAAATTAVVPAASETKSESHDRDDTPPPMPISPVTVREDAPRTSSDAQSDSKWQPVSVPDKETADAIILSPETPGIAIEDTDGTETPRASRPTFEQHPSSGLLNEGAPVDDRKMPDLERHISQIPESDDDDVSEDWDADDEIRRGGSVATEGTLGKENAEIIANRVFTAPTPNKPGEAALPTTENADETLSQATKKEGGETTAITTPAAAAAKDDTTPIPSPGAAATYNTTPAVTKTTAGERHDDTSAAGEKDKKGVRGLLSKLRHRKDHSESKPATTTTKSSSSGKVPEAAGALTFPPDRTADLSSDSDSDDEGRRGRGRIGRTTTDTKLGFGNSRTTRATGTTETKKADEQQEDIDASMATSDGEQFEEARDHFDEGGLAPPTTATVEGKKSSSPAREGKFVENI